MYEAWYVNDFGYVVVFEENGKKFFLEYLEDEEPLEFFCDTEYGGGYQFDERFNTKEEAFAFIDAKHDMEEEEFLKLREKLNKKG